MTFVGIEINDSDDTVVSDKDNGFPGNNYIVLDSKDN